MANTEKIKIPCVFASGCVADNCVRLLLKDDRTPGEEERLEGYKAQLELMPNVVCDICLVRSAWPNLFDNQ